MKFLVRDCCCALLVLVFMGLAGCRPIGQTPGDEEKEPHFITGKSRSSALDYKGAIVAFEKALENNPASASAHFELGYLFDQKLPDPAAAIYHYERYLQLRPKAWNAEVVRERIFSAKQELAKTVSFGPVTEKQRKDFERLLEENKRLQEQNRLLGEENMRLKVQIAAQEASATASPVTLTSDRSPVRSPQSTVNSTPQRSVSPVRTDTRFTPVLRPDPRPSSTRSTIRRTHVVRRGETLMAISRRYGVPLATLKAANPGLDPHKLRPGNVLNVP